ncbi:MAG: PrsW family intramembrane metalloprotease [Myxococcales bacterium]|nr:PrsW family intramembrane metalloprotease [Myxococcales bacterium]
MMSAVVPSLMLIWYFRSRDVYPEPAGVLWRTFFLGVLTVIPVLIVALPIASFIKGVGDPITAGFLSAFLTAAGPEELFKLLVVVGYAARHKEFDEPMDGVVYGAVASLGFATLENILYVSSGGLGVAVMRAILAVPGHAFMGAIMGYYVGQAKFRPNEKGKLLALAYFVPFVLHGLYDWPLLAAKSGAELATRGGAEASNAVLVLLPVTFATFIFEWVWTVRIIRRLRGEQLAWAQHSQGAPPPSQPVPAAPMAPMAQVYPQPSYANPYAVAPQWGAYPAQPQTNASPVLGVLSILAGVALASVGGMVTLGLILFAVSPQPADTLSSAGGMFIALVLFGALPLALGIAAFVFGIKKLNGR